MSLINAINMGDYTLVSTDTDGVFPDGKRGNVSKMLTLPHCNAIIAVRGTLMFLSAAQSQFALTDCDFDGITDAAEAVMRRSFAVIGAYSFNEEQGKGAEMILSGYSAKSGRVVAHSFRSKDGGVTFEKHLDVASIICPGDLGIVTSDIESSRDGLKKLTERQVQAVRKNFPDGAAGGRLIIAEVRKNSILLETVCELGANQA